MCSSDLFPSHDMRGLGKGVNEFKKGMKDVETELKKEDETKEENK